MRRIHPPSAQGSGRFSRGDAGRASLPQPQLDRDARRFSGSAVALVREPGLAAMMIRRGLQVSIPRASRIMRPTAILVRESLSTKLPRTQLEFCRVSLSDPIPVLIFADDPIELIGISKAETRQV